MGKSLKKRIETLERTSKACATPNRELLDALKELDQIMRGSTAGEFAEANLKAATELIEEYQGERWNVKNTES